MKHFTTLTTLLLIAYCLKSQDLHIHYNAQTSSLRYILKEEDQNKKGVILEREITRPRVRRGSNVFIHIENYNNYLYDVNVKTEQQEIKYTSESSGDLSSVLSAMKGISPGDFFNISGGRGPQDFNFDLKDGSSGSGPKAYDASFGISKDAYNKLTDMVARFGSAFERMKTYDEAIDQTKLDVQSIVSSHQQRALLLQRMEKVKYDPSASPEEIKQFTEELLLEALGIELSTDTIKLKTFVQSSNARIQLETKAGMIKEVRKRYKEDLEMLSEIKNPIAVYEAQPQLSFLTDPVERAFGFAEEKDREMGELEDKIKEAIAQIPDTSAVSLTDVWYEYRKLNSNPFQMIHRTEAEGDEMSFNVQFNPSSKGLSLNPDVATRPLAAINVPVFGGFKVNASVGVGFGQFFNQPLDYFVRDSVIRSEDKDSFYPIIATFIHFYGQSAGNTSFGGTFGIGFPIITSDNVQSASFFFGPGLIIGRNERLVLSAGLVGAKVERLAQGFRVGDEFISRVNVVPTKSVYELGYFAGLSFNLFNK